MSASEFHQVKEMTKKAYKLKQDKKYHEARIVLEEGLEEFPDNNYLKNSLADLYIRMQRLEDADNLAEEILTEDPDNYRALSNKGSIAYNKRNYTQALDYYQQAYGIKKVVFLVTRIIKTYMKLEEYQQALDLCQEWIERKPEDNQLIKLKAGIYDKMGDEEAAKKQYNQYLQQKPDDDFAYKEEIKLKIKDKSPREAVKQLRQLMRIGNRKYNVHLHTLLAEKLEEMGQLEEAAAEYKEALSLNPGDKFILQNLGYCLKKMDQPESALDYLKQAFRRDPSDYYTRSSLVATFKSLNRYQEGIEYFKDIIEENPSFKNLWGIIKKLDKAKSE